MANWILCFIKEEGLRELAMTMEMMISGHFILDSNANRGGLIIFLKALLNCAFAQFHQLARDVYDEYSCSRPLYS